MQQFNIAEAKSHFSELVKMAMLGEDIVIARDNKPLLRLVPVAPPGKVRKPGTAKGQILYVAPDFDQLPPDFKEYV
jgi:prevent-host-death family protein